jgi:hypothetical protein
MLSEYIVEGHYTDVVAAEGILELLFALDLEDIGLAEGIPRDWDMMGDDIAELEDYRRQ